MKKKVWIKEDKSKRENKVKRKMSLKTKKWKTVYTQFISARKGVVLADKTWIKT